MPLSIGVGLATSILAPAGEGWQSTMQGIRDGNPSTAIQSFLRSWTGIKLGLANTGNTETSFDLMRTINPFDMAEAPALKSTLWTALSAQLVKKIIKKDPFERIPLVNKFIKFA
jgi:hypothetical protein